MSDDTTPIYYGRKRYGWQPNPKQRRRILERDRFTCQYCGRVRGEDDLHVDHVIPKVWGGGNWPQNLITACSTCNIAASDAPKAIPRRIRERFYRSPVEIPVTIYSHDSVMKQVKLIEAYWTACGYKRSPVKVVP